MCCMSRILQCGFIIILSIVGFGGGFYLGWITRQHNINKQKPKAPAPAAADQSARSDGLMMRAHSMQNGGFKDMPGFYHYMRAGQTDEVVGRDGMVHHNAMHDVRDSSTSEWYSIEQDSILLTPDKCKAFLVAVEETFQVPTSHLLPYAASLPLYLRSTARDVMQLLREFVEAGDKFEGYEGQGGQRAEVEAQLRAALDSGKIVHWLQGPWRQHEVMMAEQSRLVTPSIVADAQTAFAASNPSYPLHTLTVVDPMLQISSHAQRMHTSQHYRRLQQLEQQQQQRSAVAYRRGLQGSHAMGTRCIGVVVHVLQYSDSQGYRAPLNAYWGGDSPLQNLLHHVNQAFQYDTVPIQFYLAEHRSDPQHHPYLLLPSHAHWQDCYFNNASCLQEIASHSNVDPSRYINIYTLGSSTLCEDCCYSCPHGYSTHVARPGVESESSQYIALLWDMVDPAVANNHHSHQMGSATLIQELGHYLGGLLHTHQGGCGDEGGDLVGDTPPEHPMYDAPWYGDLKAWCVKQRECADLEGLLPSSSSHDSRLSSLASYKSCGQQTSHIDNVMNYMSYAPHECRVHFTLGQVQQLVAMAWYTRPNLWASSVCYTDLY